MGPAGKLALLELLAVLHTSSCLQLAFVLFGKTPGILVGTKPELRQAGKTPELVQIGRTLALVQAGKTLALARVLHIGLVQSPEMPHM